MTPFGGAFTRLVRVQGFEFSLFADRYGFKNTAHGLPVGVPAPLVSLNRTYPKTRHELDPWYARKFPENSLIAFPQNHMTDLTDDSEAGGAAPHARARQPISPQERELRAVRESIKLAQLKKASLDQRLWTYLRGKMATAGPAEEAAAPLTSLNPNLTSGGSGSDDDWMVISSGSSSSDQTAPRREGAREDASLTRSAHDDELEQEQIRADDDDDDGLALEENDSEGEDGLCLEDNPNEEDAAHQDNLVSDGDDGLCLEEN